jgi:trimeric autotransporter adhesin
LRMLNERTLTAQRVIAALRTLQLTASSKAIFFTIGLQLLITVAVCASDASGNLTTPQKTEAIPLDNIGAKAGADYHGDGLCVATTKAGARLHCVFQRLDGEATSQGLWLISTVTNQPDDRFRLLATMLNGQTLASRGTTTVFGQIVRFTRPKLLEEYSVSVDGVRQDFVVSDKPADYRQLTVQLTVSGARVEGAAYGAQLLLEKSGRKIAYGRLRATDANGKELPTRIQVRQNSSQSLAIVVDDSDAVYPVRIDPTFSDANWVSINPSIPGTDGTVYAMVTDSSGNLYIGGQFLVVGNDIARNIVEWKGNGWYNLGSGLSGPSSYVRALAVSGSTLYVGGQFEVAGGITVSNIAQWNGSTWSALGLGLSGQVNALTVSGGAVFAGGFFEYAFNKGSALRVSGIAEWGGSSWSALGLGLSGTVNALAVAGSTLFAGGSFQQTPNGTQLGYIGQWNGSSWSALGSGLNGTVNALAISGATLYAGGQFTSAVGGATANYIAQWNGTSWSALGSGMNPGGQVNALAISGGTLYAGGFFTTAGGTTANDIAQWNGSSWSSVGSGVGTNGSGYAYALATSSGTLYAGGFFTTAGTNVAKNIAKWAGGIWSPLATGMNDSVLALAISGDTLYVGGWFTVAGTNVVNCIAQWNGTGWSPLSSGMAGSPPFFTRNVSALAVSPLGTLYAGGDFTTAGGVTVNNIAQWNGTSWSPVGSGVDDQVNVLLMGYGGTLYVGGQFGVVYNFGNVAVSARDIAQWNGSTWSPMGAGMSGGNEQGSSSVNALAVGYGGTLYAGGNFTMADGNVANYVAQWNGSAWSPVGLGVGGGDLSGPCVYTLATLGGTLYVAGDFTVATNYGSVEVPANDIVQWNGIGWSPLGSGMNSNVLTLAIEGSTLYAGGAFTTAGGTNANSIAQWDGTIWSPLGSGVGGESPSVNVLATAGGALYVGGKFTIAGLSVSGYMAMLDSPSYFFLTDFGYTNKTSYFKVAGPARSNAVVYASPDLKTWTALGTNSLGLGSTSFTDSLATNYPTRFYQSQLLP